MGGGGGGAGGCCAASCAGDEEAGAADDAGALDELLAALLSPLAASEGCAGFAAFGCALFAGAGELLHPAISRSAAAAIHVLRAILDDEVIVFPSRWNFPAWVSIALDELAGRLNWTNDRLLLDSSSAASSTATRHFWHVSSRVSGPHSPSFRRLLGPQRELRSRKH
jgi:hypothetical protein